MVTSLREPYNPNRSNTSRTVLPYPYIGLVKRNDDPQHMGRLSVWIPELCGDPTDEASWIICSYCSPFAGATDITKIGNYQSNQNVGQQSYGWVGVPPDLNTEVMVVFACGEISRAYWVGCTYQQYMDHMVPGIAVNTTTDPNNPVAPVIEYNKANLQGSPAAPKRPVFTPLASGLTTEGLNKDLERGSSSTSMRRESPPLVYGYLTPRGNTIHVDDNPQNEFIRLRTRSGAQVLVHETTGYIYINSKTGNSWIEISDAGIDAFTTNSVSIRAQQDVNVRADRNIVLDAGGNIFMRAGQQITLSAGTDIQGGAARNLVLSSGSQSSLKSGTDTLVNAGGNLRLQSGSDTSSLAGGAWYRQGNTIFDNCGNTPPANANNAVGPQGKDTQDTTPTMSNGAWIWRYGSGKVNTIVSRMPTHEPWYGHPRSDVPPPPTENSDVNYGATNGAGSSSNTYPDGTLNDTGCSFGVANTKPISTDVYNAISSASAQTGADPATMFAFADIESSFQPGVGAGTSSATGLYQFTSGTWNSMVTKYGNQYNVPTDPNAIHDPNYNALMGGQFIKDNTAILQSQGISNPTPGQLYIMHFLGSNGGPKLISAAQNDPSGVAASSFPAAAAANKSIFYNSDGSPKSNQDVYNLLTGKADSKAQAYANQYGLDAPCNRGNGVAGNSPSAAAQPANPNIDPNNPSASYSSYLGKTIGSGQCVALVENVGGLPTTASWQAGQSLYQNGQLNPDIPPGTPIATFDPNGTYGNHTDLTSHAAIYLGPAPGGGIQVLDQYAGQPAQIRNISLNASKPVVNNAANYRVINIPSA